MSDNIEEPTPEIVDAPWEELARLLEAGDHEAAQAWLFEQEVDDRMRAITRLEHDLQVRLFERLDNEDAAELMHQLPVYHAGDLLESLEPARAAAIVAELRSDHQADLLAEVEDAYREAIYAAMPRDEAEDTRSLMLYDEDTAGGLMITEFLAYPSSWTVRQVVDDLRSNVEEYADYDIQYVYVTGDAKRLVGVLRLRDLLLARQERVIDGLMIEAPYSVADQTPLEELESFFDDHAFFGVPAVDDKGRLVGVVKRSAVEHAVAGRADRQYQEAQGIIGGEELRSMPTMLRSRRRLMWLVPNILLNIIAASVIAMNTSTIEAVIALAVFLPIISDMSGCSGNQAVAVSMRELTLGLIKPAEFMHVWRKEVSVGLMNGLVLGVLIAAVSYGYGAFFTDGGGNVWLGLVVGGALALNTVVAVSIGGLVPLLLKRFELDPALASGPILTTCTDMCGFFLVLTLAGMMMKLLV